jgi:hypothetical protein
MFWLMLYIEIRFNYNYGYFSLEDEYVEKIVCSGISLNIDISIL